MNEEIYVTELYDMKGIKRFEDWLDMMIGTEYERDELTDGQYELVIYDLNMYEVEKIRKFEKGLRP